MATLQELMLRAQLLRQETAVDSISPERAGGIMYDTLAYINQMQLQDANPLLISKIYASVAAMEADSAPVSDLTGQPLRPGQVVVIASSDSDNGSVYRYNGGTESRWTVVGKIGNLTPVDSLASDSTQLPLAARQGKVLDEKVAALGHELEDLSVPNFTDNILFGGLNGNLPATTERVIYYNDFYCSILRKKPITTIVAEFGASGSFSVYKTNDRITVAAEIIDKDILVQTFQVTSGVNILELDTPLVLNYDEYIGFVGAYYYYQKDSVGQCAPFWGRNALRGYANLSAILRVGVYTRNYEVGNNILQSKHEIYNNLGGNLTSIPITFLVPAKGFSGKEIVAVKIDAATTGTFSIVKGSIINGQMNVSVVRTIRVASVGAQEIRVGPPIVVGSDEYIGVGSPNDTVKFKYLNNTVDGDFECGYVFDNNGQLNYSGHFLGVDFVVSERSLLKHIVARNPAQEIPHYRFSIIGDSISTYEAYNPAGYATYYPKGTVNNVNFTWWKQLERLSGMTLLKNCSWSGSKVTGDSQSETAQPGCSTTRILDLANGNIIPDIVIIDMATNDFWASSNDLGDWSGNDNLPQEGVIQIVSDAYALMVSKVLATYPKSRVFICTLPELRGADVDTGFPARNSRGQSTYQYNEMLRIIAKSFGCGLIDFHSCGIVYYNTPAYTIDGVHPNRDGMLLMAKKAYADLLAQI